jgi:hypothetical protein
MRDKTPENTLENTLDDKPPFFTWRALYIVVALSLVVEIAAFAALRWIYR